ncbi:hypothetical protein [Caproicibacterium amylolyticum]|uniref:Uncharacterized protein n=1 Tax=Caproicibacterium amylolyticum TaxID=2766537 RepID=A0A7G9WGB0_9FIRM|nr:hypothetical protein [Caproicibacterium amylolyticum]QNO17722.1 hypothetical protein H6X83_12465 [Caproicibacterium amylolyticum]
MRNEKGCTGCGFHAARGVIQCEYCLLTGHPRGCPTGPGCTKRQTPAQVAKPRKQVQRAGLAPAEPWDAIWT